MRSIGEDIEALVAGELAPEEVDRVLAAIATDPAAQAELDEALQLRAAAHGMPAKRAVTVEDDELTSARRKRSRLVIAVPMVVVVAAAAAVTFYFALPRAPGFEDRFVAALAPRRELQPRLTWPVADRYRPYDPPRAAGSAKETLSRGLLADAEQARDPRALVAAEILAGELDAADKALAGAKTADAMSDRAALALVLGDADRALVNAAAALELDANHPQAAWNRALALHALGLDRSAAAVFDKLAARNERGWSDEARAQATALHASRKTHEETWTNAVTAGRAMVAGGPIPKDLVAVVPGWMRLSLYDAVRAAPSAARVKELAPLADALDAAVGGDVLHRYVERIAQLPFDARAPLAARYANLVAGKLDDTAKSALIADARAAKQDDILLGALLLGGPGNQVTPANLDEYVRLAGATGDPWFELLATEQRSAVASDRADWSGAASLLGAVTRCDAPGFEYRCMKIWRQLAESYQHLHRLAASAEALGRARRAAAVAGSVPIENDLLRLAALLAGIRDDTSATWQALSAAYVDELDLASVETCDVARTAREEAAMGLVNRNRIAEARKFLAAGPACNAPMTAHRGFVLAHTSDRADRGAVDALHADLVALRDNPATAPGDRVVADHSLGRLLIDTSPDEGRAVLRKVIATRVDEANATRARSYSYSVLIQDAARHAQWSSALELLAGERGVHVPTSCVLGAAEEVDSTFVARGLDGREHGVAIPRAVGEPLGEASVPADIVAALRGCPVIDVLARQPYYGRASLLPTELPWRFRVGPPNPVGPLEPVLVVANIAPPAALHLAPLNPIAAPQGATLVEGAAATPDRVMAAMADAGFVEIHSHGLSNVDDEAALLVLAPDVRGSYALASSQIAAAKLARHPVVVLAACESAATGRAFYTADGLADAFVSAGASAVIASPEPINDAAAPRFFAGVRARITAGASPAKALVDERTSWTAPEQRAWIDHLVVFQ
jgi:CHAT domain